MSALSARRLEQEASEGKAQASGRSRSARPSLKVIEHRPLLRRIPWSVATALVFVVGFLFMALWTHVALIGGQQRLDDLHEEIRAGHVRQEKLRRQESQLGSPGEILRVARDELGMIREPEFELVAPVQSVIGPYPLVDGAGLKPASEASPDGVVFDESGA